MKLLHIGSISLKSQSISDGYTTCLLDILTRLDKSENYTIVITGKIVASNLDTLNTISEWLTKLSTFTTIYIIGNNDYSFMFSHLKTIEFISSDQTRKVGSHTLYFNCIPPTPTDSIIITNLEPLDIDVSSADMILAYTSHSNKLETSKIKYVGDLFQISFNDSCTRYYGLLDLDSLSYEFIPLVSTYTFNTVTISSEGVKIKGKLGKQSTLKIIIPESALSTLHGVLTKLRSTSEIKNMVYCIVSDLKNTFTFAKLEDEYGKWTIEKMIIKNVGCIKEKCILFPNDKVSSFYSEKPTCKTTIYNIIKSIFFGGYDDMYSNDSKVVLTISFKNETYTITKTKNDMSTDNKEEIINLYRLLGIIHEYDLFPVEAKYEELGISRTSRKLIQEYNNMMIKHTYMDTPNNKDLQKELKSINLALERWSRDLPFQVILNDNDWINQNNDDINSLITEYDETIIDISIDIEDDTLLDRMNKGSLNKNDIEYLKDILELLTDDFTVKDDIDSKLKTKISLYKQLLIRKNYLELLQEKSNIDNLKLQLNNSNIHAIIRLSNTILEMFEGLSIKLTDDYAIELTNKYSSNTEKTIANIVFSMACISESKRNRSNIVFIDCDFDGMDTIAMSKLIHLLKGLCSSICIFTRSSTVFNLSEVSVKL